MMKTGENFELVEKYLHEKGIKFETQQDQDGDSVITFLMNGENLNFPVLISFWGENLRFLSMIPNKIKKPNIELYQCLNKLNYEATYGKFILKEDSQVVAFECIFPTHNVQVSQEIIDHLIIGSCIEVDNNASEIIKFA